LQSVILTNYNLVGSCVSTIFCLLHSMYDLCIMIMCFYCRVFFVGMHHGWFLCNNHACVGIQLTFKYIWQSHLYAHVIVTEYFWKYVGLSGVVIYEWIWQSMYVKVSFPLNRWFEQLCEMEKERGKEVKFFPKIIILTFQGI